MAKEMMLRDVQTMTFTAVGIQVQNHHVNIAQKKNNIKYKYFICEMFQKTSVASKPGITYYGFPHNQVKTLLL